MTTTLIATNRPQESRTSEPNSGVQIVESQHSSNPDTSATDLFLTKSYGKTLGGSAFASTARMAGRMNAASVKEEDYKKLLDERQELLDRKFAGEATRPMLNRLEYVRWSLDRIEDARHGASLDALEAQIERFEELRREIASLGKILETHLPSSSHRKR